MSAVGGPVEKSGFGVEACVIGEVQRVEVQIRALRIECDDFRRLEWLPYLDRLKHLEFRRGKISCDGAATCAETIMSHYPGRAT